MNAKTLKLTYTQDNLTNGTVQHTKTYDSLRTHGKIGKRQTHKEMEGNRNRPVGLLLEK
jgi:hypothetical protein